MSAKKMVAKKAGRKVAAKKAVRKTAAKKVGRKVTAKKAAFRRFFAGPAPSLPPLNVVRTDLYFSSGRALSVACIRTGTNAALSLGTIEGWQESVDVTSEVAWRDNALEQFIYGLSIIRPEIQRFPDWPRDFINEVLLASIVIERSPVSRLSLQSLLSQSPHIAVGTYVGMNVVGDHQYLMLATVPGAIVAIGAAIGISQGLMHGLAQAIERIVKTRLS
jgi:hypothetical protein